MTMPADPRAVLRSPDYTRLLVLAALIGAPIAAAAWGFLWLVGEAQEWLYTNLPSGLGFDDQPTWWPLPLLALAGRPGLALAASPDFDAASWIPVGCDNPDLISHTSPASSEFVGDGQAPAAFYAFDQNFLYFRYRMDVSPSGPGGFAV